ncbi:UNVERIFIED_CONTAM: hypothetical protein Sradi_4589600 [Sesamum radiatum]|uniref:S-protein homolog n=1 Tax=Sesamum radiatum TaxID=300843 RepID=A0AAW2NC71_SESRA
MAIEKAQCFLSRKFEVHIVSNLPPQPGPLVAHCASKDDDLGNHTLTTDQDFDFNFCVVPFTTLFFCHLWWGNKDISFDVFNTKTIMQQCTDRQCYWAAKSDGIYFAGSYPPEGLHKVYSW